MKPKTQNRGFTLISALFLLVVVAMLSVYMISLRSVQGTTVVYSIQGARAMQAARAGMEWGVYQAIARVPPSCVTSNFSLPGTAFNGFNINVECASSDHVEGSSTIRVYRLEVSAESGVYGTLDYVFRRLRATVSQAPP